MILCITPNPAVDRTLFLPGFALGAVHRAREVLITAGGKGLNVARTIHTLGGHVLCAGFVGGLTGRLLTELAQEAGLNASWTWTKSETRSCTILMTQGTDSTVINEPGMAVSSWDWERLRQDVREQIDSASLVCISGSLPPGSPVADWQALLEMLVDAGKPVWVDASGAVLKAALNVSGICMKVNGNEIGEVLGEEVNDVPSAKRALTQLTEGGMQACAITLGPGGALLAAGEEKWQAQGPSVQAVSSVGSGDSFLGGLVHALDLGRSWPEALREAVAAGTANALSPGAGRFELQEFEGIRGRVQVNAW